MKLIYFFIVFSLVLLLSACLDTPKKKEPDPAYSQLDIPVIDSELTGFNA